jgi:hypothetical protein
MKSITKSTTLPELAGIVSEHLKSKSIQATLVGGAVVTIYSKNEYQSRDLDFISPNENKEITEAMTELGFQRKGKDFYHPSNPFTIEFPTGPVAIGNEIPVKPEGELETKAGVVKLLSPTQCVMDRLAWFYHYNDRQCLDQAIAVAKNQKINLSKIKKWSEGEGSLDKYEVFVSKLKQ